MDIINLLTPLISLIFCIVFFSAFAKTIKKRPVVFYLIAVVFTVLTLVLLFTSSGHHRGGPPRPWYYLVLSTLFGRAIMPTSIFMLVMYIGALPNKNNLRKKLMPIRGEMSIIAGFLVLVHNIKFGKYFFITLFTNPSRFSATKLAATLVSLVAVIIFIPLFITSFKTIRKK